MPSLWVRLELLESRSNTPLFMPTIILPLFGQSAPVGALPRRALAIVSRSGAVAYYCIAFSALVVVVVVVETVSVYSV